MAAANEQHRDYDTLFDALDAKISHNLICGTLLELRKHNPEGCKIFETIVSTGPVALFDVGDVGAYTFDTLRYHLQNNLQNTIRLKGVYGLFKGVGTIIGLSNSENNVRNKTSNDSDRKNLWDQVISFFEEDLHINGISNEDAVDKRKELATLIDDQTSLLEQQQSLQSNLYRISRFKIDLDEKYLKKIDVTDFVSSYNYTQKMDGIDWSITFNNGVIDIGKNSPYFIKPMVATLTTSVTSTISQSTSNEKEFTNLLAQSENEDDNFLFKYDETTDIIQKSMANRSVSVTRKQTLQGDTEQIDPNNPKALLSDLIQKYDFVSLYIYKSSTALTADISNISDNDDDLIKLGFSNEFNGFVFDRLLSISVKSVNTFTASGSGISSLLDRTRVIYQPTLFTSSLYDEVETYGRDKLSVFSNIFVDKTIKQTIDILLHGLYRIYPTAKGKYYFDLARLIAENKLQTNVFTIAPFIYSVVMKRRNYMTNYLTSDQINDRIEEIDYYLALEYDLGASIENTFQQLSNIQLVGFNYPIDYHISSDDLKAYFTFIDNNFSNFSPVLKTPNEILNEIKKATMIEVLEKSNGTIVIRSPKYNDTDSMVNLSDISVISRKYNDSGSNLISKEKLSYQPQMNLNIPFQLYSFTNGKDLLQYGLNEVEATTNPSVNYSIENDDQQQSKKVGGIFQYCRLYLELSNAAQKTCSIDTTYQLACDPIGGDSGFQVGHMVFDELMSKIFYITSITKSCVIEGDLMMTINGTYVRDCYNSHEPTTTLEFRKLPTLEDLNSIFAKIPNK